MPMKKLVIADDEPSLRLLVATTLSSHDYEILQASDGVEALRLVEQEKPDLVLLDVMMPGLTGIEVCERIKANPELVAVPVIMLTAQNDSASRERALAAGANTYLTKPFSPLQLLDLVGNLIGSEVVSAATIFPQPAAPSTTPSSALAAFMFADIRGFTGFTKANGDEAAYELVQQFQRLTRQHYQASAGKEVNTAGDNVLVIFTTTRQAVQAASAIMQTIKEYNETRPKHPLSVGIGIDVGEPQEMAGSYIGGALNRASRVCDLSHGGQILITSIVRQLAGDIPDHTYGDIGLHMLRGLEERRLFEVLWPGAIAQNSVRTEARRELAKTIARHAARVGAGVLAVLTVIFSTDTVLSGVALVPQRSELSGRLTPTSSLKQAEKTTPEIIEGSRPFTVRIISHSPAGDSYGTGVIVDTNGTVITNAHVVQGFSTIEVALASGVTLSASLIGRDAAADIALLLLPEGQYAAADFDNSDIVRVGESVIVLGYPTAFSIGGTASATQGIVSQTGVGASTGYIQIDAAMNPGVSGAPLLNRSGKVIGINVGRVESDSGRAVEGIGFAIPSNVVKSLINRLKG